MVGDIVPGHQGRRGSRLRTLIAKIGRRSEVRQAGLITLGTVIAQIILLGSTPILSRLYSPAAFGHLAVLMAASTIGGSVASLCYHYVIFLPRSTRSAAAVYRLNMYLAPLGSAICTAVFAGFTLYLGGASKLPDLWLDLLLVFLGVLLTAQFTVLGNVESRADHFWAIALSKVNNTLAPTVTQIALALAGWLASGLLVGRVIGQVATVGVMFWGLPKGFRARDLQRPRWKEVRVVAIRYRDAILHVPRVLVVRAATSLPAALILASYGPVAAGLYFMAERLIERPGLLLSDTLLRLPIKTFAERVREKQPVARLALIYTAIAFLIIFPAVLLLAVSSSWLLTVLLGARWSGAAEFTTILAIATGVRLTTLPMSALVPVLRIHSWSMVFDFVFFLRVLSIPLAAAAGYDATMAVLALATLGVCYNICICITSYAAALRSDASHAVAKPGSD